MRHKLKNEGMNETFNERYKALVQRGQNFDFYQ